MEVLLVSTLSVSKEDFGLWLECTPVLKQLTLGNLTIFGPPYPMPMYTEGPEECTLDDSYIKMLTPEQNQPYLCPNLKIFRCALKSRVSGDAVLAFLMARTSLTESHSRIEEVSMHELPYDFPFGGKAHGEDERLKQIREAGVRLSFKKTFYYQLDPVVSTFEPVVTPGYSAGFRFV
jgi:hypothetical protein